jgi:hypothetical protein
MESRVGPVLREARNRRKIDLSEVEAATRIRVRFLRAVESEEWDVLPGGVYTRGFIRTYASFLGLDGERLVEDYRKEVEGSGGGPVAPSTASGHPRGRRSLADLRWLAVPAVLLVTVLAIVALPGGGGGDGGVDRRPIQREAASGAGSPTPPAAQEPVGAVSVQLAADAEVWVCMLDAEGEELVDGQILEAGAEEGPFRSGSFTVSFGNGEVTMLIDGREAEIPATSSPIGYSIDASGAMTELGETERPTCT